MAHKRFVRGGRQRREMIWISAGLGAATIVAATTLLSTLNAAALALRPFTIVRTRLAIIFSTDQVAASESFFGVYTKQVVTEQAAAAGVASVPSGTVEQDADFYVYEPIFQSFELSSGSGFETKQGDQGMHVVDSKAMRKVGNNDDIASVLDTRAFAGAIIAIEGRTLIKLH